MRLVDRTGIEILDVEECRRLLAGAEVGRLGVVDGGQPVILPVNYLLAGDAVVFRTAAGTKLRRAHGSPACFEVDDIDRAGRAGWSVVVVGRLEEVTGYDGVEVQHLRDLPLSPWAPGDRSRWMRLTATRISGRRVGPVSAA